MNNNNHSQNGNPNSNGKASSFANNANDSFTYEALRTTLAMLSKELGAAATHLTNATSYITTLGKALDERDASLIAYLSQNRTPARSYSEGTKAPDPTGYDHDPDGDPNDDPDTEEKLEWYTSDGYSSQWEGSKASGWGTSDDGDDAGWGTTDDGDVEDYEDKPGAAEKGSKFEGFGIVTAVADTNPVSTENLFFPRVANIPHCTGITECAVALPLLSTALEKRQLYIERVGGPEFDERGLTQLAVFIGEKWVHVKRFMSTLKRNLNYKQRFMLDLSSASQHEVSYTTQLANMMRDAGLLSEYHYQKSPYFKLHAAPPRVGEGINFATGTWLELYVASVAVNVANSIATTEKPVEFANNVVLSDAQQNHYEVDLLMLWGETLIWLEAKTSTKFQDQIPKLRSKREMLNLDTEQSLMLCTEYDEANAPATEAIAYQTKMTHIFLSRLKVSLLRALNAV